MIWLALPLVPLVLFVLFAGVLPELRKQSEDRKQRLTLQQKADAYRRRWLKR
jgi:hypothetical protein